MTNKKLKILFKQTIVWIILIFVCIVLFFLLEGVLQKPKIKLTMDPIIEKIPKETLLKIPTYEGSGQAVHPDIVYFPKPWNGHRFYLAITPYPYSDDDYENPSILVSDNGYDFKEEKPGLNPLVKKPPIDHNDDPDLFYDEKTDELYMYYLETMRPKTQNVIMLKSPDGIKWEKKKIIGYNLKKGEDFILSPSVIKKDPAYYMFHVVRKDKKNSIRYYLSKNGIDWNKEHAYYIDATYPTGFIPWHLNVFQGDDGMYYMLCNGYFDEFSRQDLYLSRSEDLKTWEVISEPVLKNSPGYYNSENIYRSSGLTSAGTIAIWYSFQTRKNEWHTGIVKQLLPEKK